jgi:hypothetical protein
MSSNGYHALSRNDLRGFNEPAINLIVSAMSAGAVGRVSNKGHAILRAPNGGTMSVSKDPTKANRGLQNQLSDFRRLFGCEPEDVKRGERVAATMTQTVREVPAQQKPEPVMCTAKGCNKVFATEGARYSHVERDHAKCRVPGCGFAAIDRRGEAAHYRMHHKGDAAKQRLGKPATGAAAEAKARAEAKVEPAVPAQAPAPAEVLSKQSEERKQLSRIRDILGPDPRVKDLQARLEQCGAALQRANDRIGELEAKLKLMKEALEL